MNIDDSDIDLLLLNAVNSQEFAKQLASWLEPDILYMFPALEWQHAVWFEVYSCVTKDSGHLPAPDYLAKAVYATAKRLYGPDSDVPSMAAKAVEEMSGITPFLSDALRIAKRMHDVAVKRPTLDNVFEQAKVNQQWDDLAERVNAVEEESRSLFAGLDDDAEGERDFLSVLDHMDEEPLTAEEIEQMERERRILTGTPLDELLRGFGVYKGFVTLVVGPSGGGKTLLNNQLASSLSSKGMSGYFLNTEEDITKSVEARARLFAAATKVSVDEWLEVGADPRLLVRSGKLSEAELDRLRDLRKYIKFPSYDGDGMGSIDDIIERLRTHYSLHQWMYDLVVIDWCGPLAKRMVDEHDYVEHDALERITMLAYQKIAKVYQCAVIVYHQTEDAVLKRKGVFGRYVMGDTQNCHKMHQHTAATIYLSPVDDEMRLRLILTKSRFDPNVELVCYRDYQRGRLKVLPDMVAMNGRFVSKNGSTAKKMPGSEGGYRRDD